MKLRPRSEVFVFKEDRVLADLSGPYVIFPGGGIEDGEAPVAAAKRETMEEAGRRLIAVTPAHAPTIQIWPDAWAGSQKWLSKEGHSGAVGGYSYWFTGLSSDEPTTKRHADFQPAMEFHAVADVLQALARTAGSSWPADHAVRTQVLRTYELSRTPIRSAKKHAVAGPWAAAVSSIGSRP